VLSVEAALGDKNLQTAHLEVTITDSNLWERKDFYSGLYKRPFFLLPHVRAYVIVFV
jgi:hypothetical protein